MRAWKRQIRRLNPLVLLLLFFFLLLYYEGLFSWLWDTNGTQLSDVSSGFHIRELLKLRSKVQRLTSVLKKHKVPEEEYVEGLLPTIYVITPTYARPQQKAELTRLKNVFLHVPSLHWIVVEDAEAKSHLVSHFLATSGLSYTHLFKPTPPNWKLDSKDPRWLKPRGVLQRNAGIWWLQENYSSRPATGVVYFADDDNTYSAELFEEMRWTRKASVWPVGLVGGIMVERPRVDSHGKVTGWLVAWHPERAFAMDMSGFAVSLSLLQQKSWPHFSHKSRRGYMESDFLQKLVHLDELEPKAKFCTKVLVWHTRTENPKLDNEEQLQKKGRRTDDGIEV